MGVLVPLRALLVEDSQDDADLIVRELRRGGFGVSFERVESRAALAAALDAGAWDVVLSDYSLPTFDAPAALAVVRERGLDVPFLIVSGTMGEEAAVKAIKAGAQDFILKGNLGRLVLSVERELREAKDRRAHEQAEAALRLSEMRFRRLAESGIIGIFFGDGSSKIREANDTFLQTVGYSRDDLNEGRLDATAMTPPEWLEQTSQALEELAVRGATRPREKEYIRKDGSRVPVLLAVATVGGSEYLAVSLDLSERKALEEQFRQAQKMEAVGRLAGGIAHDFNNLLSVVLSYASLAADALRADDPVREDILEIERAGRRATELTSQLLAFSRQQVVAPRIIDLNDSLVKIDKMLRRLLGDDIELRTLRAKPLWPIKADPGQIDQIVMNLAVNARDAMPEGGKLTIETANVELDDTFVQVHLGIKPGPHVMLVVSDMGVGMDRATQARIFEPFFTTKEVGKGTGLGLSTVFGIVQQSGGSIWVYSEPGLGTTFKLYFPRAAGSADAPVSSASKIASTGETILLTEDDAQLRQLVGGILRRAGYHVLVAATGAEAVQISEGRAETIHLLLTDVVMPGMNGRVLAEKLQPARPAMKILYMSGYTDDVVVHHGVLDAGVAFLQKPVTPDVLLKKIRSVLDR